MEGVTRPVEPNRVAGAMLRGWSEGQGHIPRSGLIRPNPDATAARIAPEASVVLISDQLPRQPKKVGDVFIWCLPSLLSFVFFFFSFPIDRRIPFWPHLTIVEIFLLWFLFVTPITIVIGFVVFMKRRRLGGIASSTRLLIWATQTVSLLVNALILFAIWAAIYF
jgi:hypothetical protein